jgi:hypothetical protein
MLLEAINNGLYGTGKYKEFSKLLMVILLYILLVNKNV